MRTREAQEWLKRHFCTVLVNHAASASQLSENMLRLLGQGKHMAEIKQTEEAVFKKTAMLYQNLALWYYIVPKVSLVFMKHLYYIYKMNAQAGGFSRHQV